jgi:hypothetical protein
MRATSLPVAPSFGMLYKRSNGISNLGTNISLIVGGEPISRWIGGRDCLTVVKCHSVWALRLGFLTESPVSGAIGFDDSLAWQKLWSGTISAGKCMHFAFSWPTTVSHGHKRHLAYSPSDQYAPACRKGWRLRHSGMYSVLGFHLRSRCFSGNLLVVGCPRGSSFSSDMGHLTASTPCVVPWSTATISSSPAPPLD